MNPLSTFNQDIYPGTYHPEPGIEERVEKASWGPSPWKHFRTEIIEAGDVYIIRIHTGNLEKENIFVYTTTTDLLLYSKKRKHNVHDTGLLKYMIELPSDADTNFSTSEFSPGLLTIYFSKRDKQMKNYPGRIIVY